jgi:starch-binding outer membrane protein, SusD/RagB family
MMLERTIGGAAGIVLVMSLASCDLSVENLGPVEDAILNEEGAHSAVVAGAEYNVSWSLNMVRFFGADAAKELTQGGRIHPIKLPPNPGQLDIDEQLPDDTWNRSHRARWVAEDGVRRLKEQKSDFATSTLGAQILLYAGYANRQLGENMCEAVLDGGPVQPRTVHLEAAEAYFTEALTVASAANATALVNAARAGRASVRLHLGKDGEAAADAALVPIDFSFEARYGEAPEAQRNWIHFINSNTPYRAQSVWNTYYDDYFEQTGDPRVAWRTVPGTPTAEFTNVPYYEQRKYTSNTDPVNLSSGREMVLVRAEVALKAGNWQEALTLVNTLREGITNEDGQAIPLWTATNATEAWSALKRERGIELWLEGRRLGDLYRWVANSTPGEMESVQDRIRLCFPVGQSERQSNRNVGLTHESPTNPLFTGS